MKVRTKLVHSIPPFGLKSTTGADYTNYGSIAGPCTNEQALLLSSGHPWPPKDGRDHGGPFTVKKTISRYRGFDVSGHTFNYASGIWSMKGKIYAYPASKLKWSTCPTVSSDSLLDALGTTAIANCLPTNPISGLAQFIGEAHELKDMFSPHEWKKQLDHFRKVPHKVFADKFLEYEFGWLPLISDIRSFFKATNNLNKIALQYERDSGRNIRRKRRINSSSSTVTSVQNNFSGYPALVTQAYQSFGKQYTTTTTSIEQWFSGCFTYYLPPIKKPGIIGDYAHYEAITNKLFGQRITAETVWNLTPWSWAIDWQSNAGDVIHNWQAFQRDGLVMRYGYVMEHKTVLTSIILKDLILQDGTPVHDRVDLQYETKTRRGATPYGFGLNPGSFTSRQNAIIAALAIQRAK
jgi:hypothetical protein